MACGKEHYVREATDVVACGDTYTAFRGPCLPVVYECDKCKIKRLEAVIAQRNIMDVATNACQNAHLLSEELSAAMERIADLIVERDAARAVISELRIELEIYRKGTM